MNAIVVWQLYNNRTLIPIHLEPYRDCGKKKSGRYL